ncbi:MAG: hypothetical protein E6J89_17705 [Deltaproteobacteria bacterium]|nr:MAG: hypothetical protein E6J89_17705 [Deltaproteobacteria bacterium]
MQVTVVDSEYAGMRLDLFLARQRLVPAGVGDWSRSGIQRMIQAGQVVLNGRTTKPSARLKASGLRFRVAARTDSPGYPLRGCGLYRGQQAPRNGGASGCGETKRDSGERPPLSLSRSSRHRRRA